MCAGPMLDLVSVCGLSPPHDEFHHSRRNDIGTDHMGPPPLRHAPGGAPRGVPRDACDFAQIRGLDGGWVPPCSHQLHGGIFAFMVVFLTFAIRRARVRPTLDLLDGSVRARYFSQVAVYSWMRRLPQTFW